MKAFKELKIYLLRYKWLFIAGVLMLALVDAFQLIMPRIMKATVDALTFGTATPELLLKYALILLALAMGVGVTRFMWRYCIVGSSRMIERDMRLKFYSVLLKQNVSYFNRTKVGELMALATNDLEAVRMMTGMAFMAFFDTIIMLTASVVLLALLNWKLTLYVLIPAPFLSGLMIIFGKRIHALFKAVQDSFSALTDKAQETFSGIRVIKSFVQEKAELENFRAQNKDFLDKNIRLTRIWGAFDPLIGFVIGICFGIVLLIGGDNVLSGGMSMGDFVAFTAYLGGALWPMIAIGWVTNLYQRGKASMDRLNAVFTLGPEVEEIKKPIVLEPMKGEIEFRNLTFAYEDSTEPVLKNISLKIPAGSNVAIIGRTGSGKTTLVRLIPRLFDVPDETLFIDGIDIRKLALEPLRRQIGFVQQESFLFSEVIIDNIKFGNPEGKDELAIECAKVSQIHDNIMEFPLGYRTMVGERGVSLSGGQKQRIAMARALFINPKILILDDSFSSVDTETEERILYELREFMKNRTSIIISHRISTVKNSDKIFVLDNGRIAEEGTHEQLLALNGIYADIERRQKLEELLNANGNNG